MNNKTITVNGRPMSIRPMTYGEVKRIRTDKELPVDAPAAWVLGENTLDDVSYPEVKAIADEIYDLTFGTKAAEGNS